MKDLETGEVFHNFKIQASTTAYFNGFGEIDGKAEYWQPVVANHAPRDSYIPSQGLILQMSVGESHDINVKGVEDSLDSRVFGSWEDDKADEWIKFIFVLHSNVAYKYGIQHLKFTDNPKHKGAKKDRAEDILNRIHQYTFTVDLEERLQALRNRNQTMVHRVNKRWMTICVTKTGDFQNVEGN